MGYSTRDSGRIKTYLPDDTDTMLYFSHDTSLDELIAAARRKWGDAVKFECIDIRAEHIHTDCIGHDVYDPSDYTDYVVLEYTPSN